MLRSVASRVLSRSADANLCLALTLIISDRAVLNAFIRFLCRGCSSHDVGIGSEITDIERQELKPLFPAMAFITWTAN